MNENPEVKLIYDRQCGCGNIINYSCKASWKKANDAGTKCKKCTHSKPDYIKLWNRFKKSAEDRDKEFTIPIEYLQGLLDGCGRRCKYTEQILDYDDMSLDRIDSSIGYIQGNVALVAKPVNMMKHVYSDAKFQSYCKQVAVKQDFQKLVDENKR